MGGGQTTREWRFGRGPGRCGRRRKEGFSKISPPGLIDSPTFKSLEIPRDSSQPCPLVSSDDELLDPALTNQTSFALPIPTSLAPRIPSLWFKRVTQSDSLRMEMDR